MSTGKQQKGSTAHGVWRDWRSSESLRPWFLRSLASSVLSFGTAQMGPDREPYSAPDGSTSENRMYYIRSRGHTRGPFSASALLKLIRRGFVTQFDEISIDRVEWMPSAYFKVDMHQEHVESEAFAHPSAAEVGFSDNASINSDAA